MYATIYKWADYIKSSIPVPIHVGESHVEDDLAPNFVKTSVRFVMSSDNISVSSITKWSICWILAVA